MAENRTGPNNSVGADVLTKPKHLQIQIVRTLGEDFLFDAAKRAYVAGYIYGDIRAFYCVQKMKVKQQ